MENGFWAKLYGSKTWCLREREAVLSIRTGRAVMRAMYEARLTDKKKHIRTNKNVGLFVCC